MGLPRTAMATSPQAEGPIRFSEREMLHRLIIVSGLFLLAGCGEPVEVKPGFEFVVDETAIFVGGPVSHCRALELADQYYCERTRRSNFNVVISSGEYRLLSEDQYVNYRAYIDGRENLNFRSPLDYQIQLEPQQVLLLTLSSAFSNKNFEGHRVVLHPRAIDDILNPAGRLEGDRVYRLEDLFPVLSEACSDALQEFDAEATEQVTTLGGIYWVVPEECVN